MSLPWHCRVDEALCCLPTLAERFNSFVCVRLAVSSLFASIPFNYRCLLVVSSALLFTQTLLFPSDSASREHLTVDESIFCCVCKSNVSTSQ